MGSNKELQVRVLRQEDLQAIAEVHVAAFLDSALSKLGKEAVRRYYLWQMAGPHDCTPLGAFVQAKLVGYCFCGVFRGALSGFVRSNRLFLVQRVLCRPWLFFNPIFRDRVALGLGILRKLLHRNRSKTSEPRKRAKEPSFGILSIAVDPSWQQSGVGHVLMRAAEAKARELDFSLMDLTVNPKNTKAICFYEHIGWKKLNEQWDWNGSMVKLLDR